MKIRKLIHRTIRHSRDGIDVAGDVNAVISANVGENRTTTRASSTQRIVQRPDHASTEASDAERRGE
jgi:hypothetical protein